MMLFTLMFVVGPRLFYSRMGRHRAKAAMLIMLFTFIAVAGPKLFRNKLVNPWRMTRHRIKAAMLMMRLLLTITPQKFGLMGRALDKWGDDEIKSEFLKPLD